MKHLLPLFALVAAPGMAQQLGNREAVVAGISKPTPAEAQQHVAQITVTEQGQVARFHKPVCPVVLGLSETVAQSVASRLRETARGIGAEVAASTCDANFMVIVTDNGSDFVSDVRRKQSAWVQGLSASELRDLIDERVPVRAWALVSARNEDGLPVIRGGQNVPPSARVMSSSILRQSTRLDIEAAFVVIDRSAVSGKTMEQIADYAAMRGLARTRPGTSQSFESVLSLFETGKTNLASELTRSDILYLQSLYRSAGTESLSEARSRLSRDIAG